MFLELQHQEEVFVRGSFMNTATDFKGAVCKILSLIPGPTNPKCLLYMYLYNLCAFWLIFHKNVTSNKTDFHCLFFFNSVHTTTEHTIQSSQPSTGKRQTLSPLTVTLCQGYRKTPQILQIWHINKSPAFQAREHKAMTFIINLGVLLYFNILAYSYSQCISEIQIKPFMPQLQKTAP